VDSYEDWRGTQAFPDQRGRLIPASCCVGAGSAWPDDEWSCAREPDAPNSTVPAGCLTALVSSYASDGAVVGWATVAILLALVLNLIVVFAFGLCLVPKSAYQEVP